MVSCQVLPATRYRMGQYDAFRDPDKVKYLRRKVLADKLESQINFFKSLEKSELNQAISKLEQYKKQVENLVRIERFSCKRIKKWTHLLWKLCQTI